MASTRTTGTAFDQLARTGKTSWRRYLAGVATIVGVWLGAGTAVQLALAITLPGALDPDSANGYSASPSGFVTENAAFAFLLIGLAVATRFIHRRPLRTLATPLPRLSAKRIATGFFVYLGLEGIAAIVWAALHPGGVTVAFAASEWLSFAPVIVLVTAVQVTAEELLFRGYLLQLMGLFTRNRWILVPISGVLFAVPHVGNPEISFGPLLVYAFYVAFGCFLAFITLRDNRIELALGAHAANNLFTALVENHDASSVSTSTIWHADQFDPLFTCVAFLIGAVVFVLLLGRKAS